MWHKNYFNYFPTEPEALFNYMLTGPKLLL